MKKIYVATVKIAIVAKSSDEMYAAMTEALTENLEINGVILDWGYVMKHGVHPDIIDKGEYDSKTYLEGDAIND